MNKFYIPALLVTYIAGIGSGLLWMKSSSENESEQFSQKNDNQNLTKSENRQLVPRKSSLKKEKYTQQFATLIHQSEASPSHNLSDVENYLTQIGYEDIDLALSWINDNFENEAQRSFLIANAFAGYAKASPQDALNKAIALPNGITKERASLAAISTWAEQDSHAAFQWMADKPITEELKSLYATAMVYHIQQDPVSSGLLISSMEQGNLKTTLAGQYSTALAESNPLQALKWGEGLSDPLSIEQATTIAFDAYLQQDIQSSFEYALQYEVGPQRTRMLGQVGLHLARTDPQLAIQEIKAFPKEIRPKVATEVAYSLSQSSPSQAIQWIQNMPIGTQYDRATETAFSQLLNHSPHNAFQLASSVSDQSKRYKLIRQASLQLYQTNPQQAEEQIAITSALTDKQRKLLQQDLRNNAGTIDIVLPNP